MGEQLTAPIPYLLRLSSFHSTLITALMQALGGVVAMDTLGVIRGWQFFDHAGHLGGVLFAG